jgi:hypothetical protein
MSHSQKIEIVTDIVNKLDAILPQVSGLIDGYLTFIRDNSLKVFVNPAGGLEVDAPLHISDQLMAEYGRKVVLYDHLITDRLGAAKDLIRQGKGVEETITDYTYRSPILTRAYEYRRLDYLNKSILTVA